MLTNGSREVTEVLGNSGWTNGALALMLAFRIERKSSRNLLKSERAKQKKAAALNVYIRTGSCIQRLLLVSHAWVTHAQNCPSRFARAELQDESYLECMQV